MSLRIVRLYMHCVPIGPYDWSFVCTFCPCILILCVPLVWSIVLAYTVHHCIHACAKNNTIFTTTCLYIPMHSHNLSLVEKCVIKLSYSALRVLNLLNFSSFFMPQLLLLMLTSSLFLPAPYGVHEHALILVHTPLCMCIRCANSTVQFLSTSLAHTHTHTHTHTYINTTTLMHRDTYGNIITHSNNDGTSKYIQV